MNQLSFIDEPAQSRPVDPLPRSCSCGSRAGVLAFQGGAIISLTCSPCGAKLDAAVIRRMPLRKPCACGAALSAPGSIAPLGPHQSLYCLSCGAWNWHVARADLATGERA